MADSIWHTLEEYPQGEEEFKEVIDYTISTLESLNVNGLDEECAVSNALTVLNCIIDEIS